MKKSLIFSVLLCQCFTFNAAVIFWDLGGTLLLHDVRQKIGLQIRTEIMKCFRAFNEILPHAKTPYNVYSDDGKTPLAPILVDFLNGFLTSEDVTNLYKKWHIGHSDYFATLAEEAIFNKIFDLGFNPTAIVEISNPSSLVSLLRKVVQKRDIHGNKCHINIILSNWAKESIEPFKKKFSKSIMIYMDEAVFSGEIHMSKPHHSIYDYCYRLICEKFPQQLKEPFFFIDDQEVNLESARKNKHHTFIGALPRQAQETFEEYKVI